MAKVYHEVLSSGGLFSLGGAVLPRGERSPPDPPDYGGLCSLGETIPPRPPLLMGGLSAPPCLPPPGRLAAARGREADRRRSVWANVGIREGISADPAPPARTSRLGRRARP